MLDAVTDDVRRTAELLFAAPATAEQYARVIAPVTLPELSEMPPVPGELRDRIAGLRAQIAQLQDELARALAEYRQPQHTVITAGAPERPLYVDRRV